MGSRRCVKSQVMIKKKTKPRTTTQDELLLLITLESDDLKCEHPE